MNLDYTLKYADPAQSLTRTIFGISHVSDVSGGPDGSGLSDISDPHDLSVYDLADMSRVVSCLIATLRPRPLPREPSRSRIRSSGLDG